MHLERGVAGTHHTAAIGLSQRARRDSFHAENLGVFPSQPLDHLGLALGHVEHPLPLTYLFDPLPSSKVRSKNGIRADCL
jgi:hypothetical protein